MKCFEINIINIIEVVGDDAIDTAVVVAKMDSFFRVGGICFFSAEMILSLIVHVTGFTII